MWMILKQLTQDVYRVTFYGFSFVKAIAYARNIGPH